MGPEKLRELFDFDFDKLGQILEASSESIHSWKIENRRIAAWIRVAKIFGRLLELLDSSKPDFARIWIHAPNALLGNVSPRDLVEIHPDGVYKLEEFLENILEGNYGEFID